MDTKVKLTFPKKVWRFLTYKLFKEDFPSHYYSPVQLNQFVLIGSEICETAESVFLNSKKLIQERESSNSTTNFPSYFNTNAKTLELLELSVKLLKPKIVVETGIANGISSRRILSSFKSQSLSESRLYSMDIDLKVLSSDLESNSQFKFLKIDRKNNFEKALKAVPGLIDIFFHDSYHSYHNQYLEYCLAWERLSPCGIIISDDINWSNAFLDFCEHWGIKPKVLCDGIKFSGVISRNMVASN